MTKLTDITTDLKKPFPIEDIDLLPKGQIERDGRTLCMALPYADVRVYQDRLNALAPGEWETPPPIALVAGNKLICYVTVTLCGISHTDVGESPVTSENAGTEAYAQAFKRTASQFGLGRYLYDLEKAWVPYNKQTKQIALDAAGVQNIVRQMYNKAHVLTEVRKSDSVQNGVSSHSNASENGTPALITEQQVNSIRKLCEHLGKPEPEGLTEVSYLDAKSSIQSLTAAYREMKANEQQAPRPTAQSMNIANDVMTADQLKAIENMYKQLGKAVPPDVRTLSRLKAEDTIRNLTTDINLARQKKEANRERVGVK